jgi:putative colanic acid biosynthesis UDP-glucose lipid carrier transferase
MKKDLSPIVTIAIFDFLLLNVITSSAVFLKSHTLEFGGRYFILLTFFNFSWLFVTLLINKYNINNLKSYWLEIKNIIKNIVLFVSFASIFAFFYKDFAYSRAIIYGSSLAFFLSQIILHFLIIQIIHLYRNMDKNQNKLLIIGNGFLGQKTLDELSENGYYNYKFIGYLDDKYKKEKKSQNSIIGRVSDASKIFNTSKIDDMIITLPLEQKTKIQNLIGLADYHGIRVKVIPDFYKSFGKNFKINEFGEIPVIDVNEFPLDNYFNALYKRLFDFFFSLTVITLLSPLYLIIAILIKLHSKGPVFYIVDRVGYKGEPFKLLKFRTMYHSDENNDSKSTIKDDPRINSLGKFLRKTNMDELPQFFNVLKGNMSVIGPRPHRVYLNKVFQNGITKYMTRHYIKPGVSGWAQVNGWRGPTGTKEQKEQRTKHDIWYIENWSFTLDLKIFFLTLFSKKVHRNAF